MVTTPRRRLLTRRLKGAARSLWSGNSGRCLGIVQQVKKYRKHDGHQKNQEMMDFSINRHHEFRYKTEFQSHESEFDYLRSLEIEEKINKIRWCQSANGALFLLSTNDKTIKFWKVLQKKVCETLILIHEKLQGMVLLLVQACQEAPKHILQMEDL